MKQEAKNNQRIWIPPVSKDRIWKLSKQIKPVVRMVWRCVTTGEHAAGKWHSTWNDKDKLHYIKSIDLFNVAYTWDPESAGEALGLKSLCDITTYHSFGHCALFKPSINEILAQIPEEHLSQVVAFEIVASPKTADDLNMQPEALNAGYHVAMTRLYVRE